VSERLDELFARARELDADARTLLLARLATEDPARAARLEALLRAAAADRSPLDADPWAILEAEAQGEEAPPERIGPYRVVSELGRGGMGRVYLALQEGDGFERRLAVKVVAPEGNRPDIERRFRQERRILAALDHEGIARFHDAGRDQDGRWYLALEYVEGSNLVDYARSRSLSTPERLRLFLAVLEAVAYAHSRAVVHRDLKPSNILVGGDGRPRLLDFGIAKFLDGAPEATATQTHTTARALTPAYASPEQVRGEPASPASDVFSLGVLLYELVAGVRPFRGAGDSRAGLERQILESDPEPPSTASRRAAEYAAVSPPSARGRLSRDLDAICLKALRKDPADRYASVVELAADLERHLGGRAVAARGDDLRYRAGRLLFRHRTLLASAAVLALAATGGVLLFSASRGAEPAARAAEPDPLPFPFSGISGRDAEALEAAFVAAPADVDTGARLALSLERAGRKDEAALVITRLRQIPGHAEDPLVDYVEASLAAGDEAPQLALVLFGQALERALAGGRGELVAQIRAARGRLLFTLGRKDEARRDLLEARRGFERAGDTASLARVLNDLAIDPLQSGRLAEGERLLEEALAASQAAGTGGAGVITGNLALIALERGFPDRAERRFGEAIAAFEGSRSRRLGWARACRALALVDLGRRDEAESELAAAIALLTEADVEHQLAHALWIRGAGELEKADLDRATATADELEAQARRTGTRAALGFANRLRGEIAAVRGDAAEARRRLTEARRLLLEGADGDWVEELDVAWAEIELAFGAPAAAREIASRLRGGSSAPIEKTTQFLAEALLARLDAAEGQRTEASKRLAELERAAVGSTSKRRLDALAAARATVSGGAS